MGHVQDYFTSGCRLTETALRKGRRGGHSQVRCSCRSGVHAAQQNSQTTPRRCHSAPTCLPRKDVEAEVRCNNKQRFQLWTENGAGRIRASQGHKMKEARHFRQASFASPLPEETCTELECRCFYNFNFQVVDSELLQPVQRAEDLTVCILHQSHSCTVKRPFCDP